MINGLLLLVLIFLDLGYASSITSAQNGTAMRDGLHVPDATSLDLLSTVSNFVGFAQGGQIRLQPERTSTRSMWSKGSITATFWTTGTRTSIKTITVTVNSRTPTPKPNRVDIRDQLEQFERKAHKTITKKFTYKWTTMTKTFTQ